MVSNHFLLVAQCCQLNIRSTPWYTFAFTQAPLVTLACPEPRVRGLQQLPGPAALHSLFPSIDAATDRDA